VSAAADEGDMQAVLAQSESATMLTSDRRTEWRDGTTDLLNKMQKERASCVRPSSYDPIGRA
jgi:hypothetical protein